jgi:Na+-translocating ferredoxin:NAD+ oxidoreductase RnfE subunit
MGANGAHQNSYKILVLFIDRMVTNCLLFGSGCIITAKRGLVKCGRELNEKRKGKMRFIELFR